MTIFHCHILAHEDQGAMAWMDVIGGRPPPLFPGDGTYQEKFSLGGTTPTPPSAPTELGASAVSTSQIDLAWTDTSGDETGFVIDRSDDGVFYTSIASVGTDMTSYSNTGLTSNTTYNYQVAAVNDAGASDYSAPASATTQAAGAGTSIAVGSVTVSTVSASKGLKFGQATIAVVDDVGNPVAGALVTGVFSGDINEGALQDQADGNGISIVQSSQSVKKLRSLQFCVTAITADGLIDYNDSTASLACGSL
jgi:hypothetical protein